MRTKFIFTILLFAFFALRADGARYYVKTNGPANGNGLSWAQAFSSPTAAFNAASTGDEVWIAQGSYFPGNGLVRNVSFDIVTGISVYGGFSGTETALNQRDLIANKTIFTGEIGGPNIEDNVANVLQVIAPNLTVLLDGIIIERGYNDIVTTWAGGLSILEVGQMTVRNCIFRENEMNVAASSGGGLRIQGIPTTGVFLVENCMFLANKAFGLNGRGGALATGNLVDHLQHNVTIRRSVFLKNEAEWYGGAVYLGGPQAGHVHQVNVQSCVFEGNTAGTRAGALHSVQNLRLEHGSFANNSSGSNQDGDGAVGKDGNNATNFHVYNSVFVGNSPNDFPADILSPFYTNVILANNQLDSQSLAGNTVASAQFVNSASGDLRLRPNSPGVNGGDASYTSTPLDVYGNPRIAMGNPDLGAHEVQNMNKPIIYVNKANDFVGSGTSWATALPELNGVDFSATSDVQVWIAEGTYHSRYTENGQSSFELSTNCDLIGGFTGGETSIGQADPANQTILDGRVGDPNSTQRSRIVVSMIGTGSHIIQNLVIQEAGHDLEFNVGGEGEMQAAAAQGGFFGPISAGSLDVLHVKSCTFKNNESDLASGAIQAVEVADLLVEDSFFDNNECFNNPSGVFSYLGSAHIENCTFTSGTAARGAIFMDTAPAVIRNCVFEGNSSSNEGAAIGAAGDNLVEVYNCRIMNNSSSVTNSQTAIVSASAGASLYVINCLLAQNTSNAIVRANGPEVVLVGSTVADNTLVDGGIAVIFGGGPVNTALNMHNTILWNPEVIERQYLGPITLAVTHNVLRNEVFPFDNPNSIVNEYPEFVSPINGDYRLRPWSPAFEAGDSQFASLLDTDLDGNNRIFGSSIDIGAYERQGGCAPDNGNCAVAESIDLGVTVTGSNLCGSSGSDPISSCNVNVGKTVWFAFEAPSSGTVEITTADVVPISGYPNFNMKQTVYSGSCGDLEEVACTNENGANAGEVTTLTGLNVGETYLVRLEGVNLQEGLFSIRIDNLGIDCPGDFNGDGIVNIADLISFLSSFGNCEEEICLGDFNNDGSVGSGDLITFLTFFGTDCE